jgi:hypothetical protein
MLSTPLMRQSDGAESRAPMTTSGRQFTLHLQFAARGSARPREYEDFLMAIPGLLKGMAYKIVDFDVLSYERTAQTNLRMNMIIFAPAIEETIMVEAKRLGIRDPVRTAATTAMMLWLKDLRLPTPANPLHAAWRTWRALTRRPVEADEKAPLYLHCYGLTPKEMAPETELVSPRSEAPSDPASLQNGGGSVGGRTVDPVNLTDPYWLPRRQHDGSTEAST